MSTNNATYFDAVPSPTALHTPSLHDALPISARWPWRRDSSTSVGDGLVLQLLLLVALIVGSGLLSGAEAAYFSLGRARLRRDRKSTRLNSSHRTISYAVFCLQKKSDNHQPPC